MKEIEPANPFFSDLVPEVVDFITQNPPDPEEINKAAFNLWQKGSTCSRIDNWNLAAVIVGLANYQAANQEKAPQEEPVAGHKVFTASSVRELSETMV